MNNLEKFFAIPDEVIIQKIYLLRGIKVMLDRDLAQLYGVDTKVLKQSVKRHSDRFPNDFMFEMAKTEFEAWRTKFAISQNDKIGLRYALKDKGFLEASYGAYDVFNPYLLYSPFTQANFDYEINKRWAFYSYFRYQFYQSLDTPLNYFTAFGAKLKIN